jgi:hypothetical protein
MNTDRELMQQALKMIRALRYRSLTDVSDEIISCLEERLAQPAPVQEPVADDIASIIACRDMLDAQPVPPRTLTRPYTTPPAPPCPTCEALARTVMLDQTSHDTQRQPLPVEKKRVPFGDGT